MSVFTTLLNRFKSIKRSLSEWREFGRYTSFFRPFGSDMYKADTVRSCIRPLANHTSKANAVCTDKKIEQILRFRPNLYMNGMEFLYKIRTMYELTNTVFILIMRDDPKKSTRPVGFYPIPYRSFQAKKTPSGELFILFELTNGGELVVPWADLAVLRKDYNSSDISGDDNTPILDTLDLIDVSNQGIKNAVKSTANLRGIVTTKQAMLAPEDLKQMKDAFVKDYMNISNEGGIAALDASMEFKPIDMKPAITNWAQMREFRENCFRYFGVNDDIIMGKQKPDQMQAFYESAIEPFLIDLSLELTGKVFTDRELGHGNKIIFEANTIQFMSTQEKLALSNMVDRGALTPNEWRAALNLHPVKGGDKPIRRLDTKPVDEEKEDPDNKEEDDE